MKTSLFRLLVWTLSLCLQTVPLFLLWIGLALQQYFTTVECATFLEQFASLPDGTTKGDLERRFGKPNRIAKLLERQGDAYKLVEEEWYYLCSDEPFQVVVDATGQFRGYQGVRSGVLNRTLYTILVIHVVFLIGLVLGFSACQTSPAGQWSLSLYVLSLVCMDVLMILIELYPVSPWRFTFRWLSVVSGMVLLLAASVGGVHLFLSGRRADVY